MAEAILWRRLDTPGHDACRLEGTRTEWILDGMAVFRHADTPAQLVYRVVCDAAWQAQRGSVHGWLGTRAVDFNIARTAEGAWTINGTVALQQADLIDLDLGFTPATNLLPIRRLDLAEGGAADAPAAWLDIATGTLERLPQRYERRSASTYWYEAPQAGYTDLLEVTGAGFIRRYPGLWEAEL